MASDAGLLLLVRLDQRVYLCDFVRETNPMGQEARPVVHQDTPAVLANLGPQVRMLGNPALINGFTLVGILGSPDGILAMGLDSYEAHQGQDNGDRFSAVGRREIQGAWSISAAPR